MDMLRKLVDLLFLLFAEHRGPIYGTRLLYYPVRLASRADSGRTVGRTEIAPVEGGR